MENLFSIEFFQTLIPWLKIANAITATYPPQTREQVERFYWSLTAILRFSVTDHKQNWDPYTSILTHAYNSQLHHSTKTLSFDMGLSWRISDLKIRSKVFTGKMITTAEKRNGLVPTPRHSLNHARAFLQRPQEPYKNSFDRRVGKGCKMIEISEFGFADLSDGVTKIPKLGCAVVGPYREFR